MKPVTLVVGALASCCTPPTEERTAIVPYSSRDADTGRYREFHCPVPGCGRGAVKTMTAWTCEKGHVSAETIQH